MEKITKAKLYLLADGGGTKTAIRLLDEAFNVIGEAYNASGNIKTSPNDAWQAIIKSMMAIIPMDQIENSHITAVLGMAGCESSRAKADFSKLKPKYIKALHLLSDAYTACLGAHGGDDGALVIIGTGIKGFQIEGEAFSDIAGWGFPYSDEGSGAWLGMQAVQHVFQVVDGRAKPSALSQMILADYDDCPFKLLDALSNAKPLVFGKFCRYVVQGAYDKDAFSCQLMDQAASEVIKLVEALKNKQKFKAHQLPLAFSGGLSQYLLAFLPESLKKHLIEAKGDALDGAEYYLKQIVEVC